MKVELNLAIQEPERLYEGRFAIDKDILNYLFETAAIDRGYNNFLKGKRVAIVGPAEYMSTSNQGPLIESYDLVARINNGWLPPQELKPHTGTRTDIRYHSGAEFPNSGGMWEMDKMIAHGVKYVAINSPRYLDYFYHDIKKFEALNEEYGVPFHCWTDLELYLTFHHYLGTRMNTGLAAIVDLLLHDVAELYITGFTFYRTGFCKGLKPERYYEDILAKEYDRDKDTMINHAQIPQMKLLKLLQQVDSRIVLDQQIINILDTVEL